MTQGVREAILNTDDVALQNSIKAALSEAMSPVNVLPSCPCDDDTVISWDFANGIMPYPAIRNDYGIASQSLYGWYIGVNQWGECVLEIEVNRVVRRVEVFVWFNMLGVTRTRIYLSDAMVFESTAGSFSSPIPITWNGNAYATTVKIVCTDEAIGGWAGIRTITIR